MTQNESIVSDYASEQEERFLEKLIFRNRFIVLGLFAVITAYLGYQMTLLRPDASLRPVEHLGDLVELLLHALPGRVELGPVVALQVLDTGGSPLHPGHEGTPV